MNCYLKLLPSLGPPPPAILTGIARLVHVFDLNLTTHVRPVWCMLRSSLGTQLRFLHGNPNLFMAYTELV